MADAIASVGRDLADRARVIRLPRRFRRRAGRSRHASMLRLSECRAVDTARMNTQKKGPVNPAAGMTLVPETGVESATYA